MRVKSFLLAAALIWTSASAERIDLKEKKVQESFWQMYTSALRGDPVAEFQVGVMYERGIGVEQNQTQAVTWYEKSAWQGHVDAQYNLALMYVSGRGAEINIDRAMIWLAKAAKQGDKEARKLLLAIIDGKLDDLKKEKETKPGNAQEEGTAEIVPVRLVVKPGGEVCDSRKVCKPYREGTVLTSKSKKGSSYRISGIATKRGWEPFGAEGWIDEGSVEIRR